MDGSPDGAMDAGNPLPEVPGAYSAATMRSSSRTASRTVAKMATIEGAAAVRTAELEPAPSAVWVGRSTVVSDAEDIPARDKKKRETTEKQIQTRLVSKLSIMWLQQHIYIALPWPSRGPWLLPH